MCNVCGPQAAAACQLINHEAAQHPAGHILTDFIVMSPSIVVINYLISQAGLVTNYRHVAHSMTSSPPVYGHSLGISRFMAECCAFWQTFVSKFNGVIMLLLPIPEAVLGWAVGQAGPTFLPPTKEEVYAIARDVCLFVCVQDYSKTRAWIWMKRCMSTDVGTWTN